MNNALFKVFLTIYNIKKYKNKVFSGYYTNGLESVLLQLDFVYP